MYRTILSGSSPYQARMAERAHSRGRKPPVALRQQFLKPLKKAKENNLKKA